MLKSFSSLTSFYVACLLLVLNASTQTIARAETIEIDAITPQMIAQCARQDNPALRIALAQLEQAKSKVTLAQRSLFPTLVMEGLLAPLPARRLLKYCVDSTGMNPNSQVFVCPNQDVQDDARLGDVDGMGVFVRTTANLTQPLYTFGKIKHGKEAAQAGYEAYKNLSDIASRQFDQLAFQVYYGLALTYKAERILNKGTRHFKKLRKQIEKEIKEGQSTTNKLRKLTVQESELKLALTEVESQRQRALMGIRLSCKLDETSQPKLKSKQLKPLKIELEDKEVYLKRALEQRSEIFAARQQMVAREALRAQAISNFFPDLALVGTFGFARGTSAEDNPDPFANDPFNVFGYGAYLGFRWRLDFAQLSSKLQEQEASLAKAKAELHGLEQQIRLEVGEQYLNLKQRKHILEIREEAKVAAKQWVTSLMMSKTVGLIKVEEALKSIQAYFTTSLSYDREVYEYNLALTRMWSLCGDDPLQKHPSN